MPKLLQGFANLGNVVCNTAFLSVSRLRHKLTKTLLKEGGHIGFDVPPSKRGNGYGTILLSLTLEKAKEKGINKVLLTCDKDNIASKRVIEKNGGILENIITSERTGKEVLRFWIVKKDRI